MDEPIFSEFSDEFSKTLLAFCEAPLPATASVSAMESQLLQHQAAFYTPAQPVLVRKLLDPFSGSISRHRWQYTVLLLFVILCAVLFAIGPQRVLAQVQSWLGYLPGAGFINPAQTRMLAAPFEARQGNATLQVQQLVAGPDKTIVVVTLHSTPEEINVDMNWDEQVTLILPNGLRLTTRQASEENKAGLLSSELEYIALPPGVLQVTLEMPKLPIVSQGAQEFWSVTLPLVDVRQASTPVPPGSAQGTANATALPGSQAVAPYTPKNAQVTNQGVTVRLLQVAQTAQDTGLLLQIEWSDPTWDYLYSSIEMRDNLGRVYEQLRPPPGIDYLLPGPGVPPRGETSAVEMLRYAPLDPKAKQVTLTLNSVNFEGHAQTQFQFDPGDHASLDQTWPYAGDPTKTLLIAGFHVQVVQADLNYAPASDQVQVANPPEATLLPQPTQLPPFACRLNFTIQVTQQPHAQLIVGPPSLVGENLGSSGMSSTDNGNNSSIFLDLPQIPTAPLTVQLSDFTLSLQGGWQLNWDLPAPAKP